MNGAPIDQGVWFCIYYMTNTSSRIWIVQQSDVQGNLELHFLGIVKMFKVLICF